MQTMTHTRFVLWLVDDVNATSLPQSVLPLLGL